MNNDEQVGTGALSTNLQNIYDVAKASLGKHITLDPSVPPDVGCAEAVSYVLKNAGISGVPNSGIPGTAELFKWLSTSGLFKQSDTYTKGAIVISPTGKSSKGYPHGHVGICGIYGILSNNSDSGLFLELWDENSWNQHYKDTLGFPVYYFVAI